MCVVHTPSQTSVWAAHHHWRQITANFHMDTASETALQPDIKPLKSEQSAKSQRRGPNPRDRYISQIKNASKQSTPIRQLTKTKALFNNYLKAKVSGKIYETQSPTFLLQNSLKVRSWQLGHHHSSEIIRLISGQQYAFKWFTWPGQFIPRRVTTSALSHGAGANSWPARPGSLGVCVSLANNSFGSWEPMAKFCTFSPLTNKQTSLQNCWPKDSTSRLKNRVKSIETATCRCQKALQMSGSGWGGCWLVAGGWWLLAGGASGSLMVVTARHRAKQRNYYPLINQFPWAQFPAKCPHVARSRGKVPKANQMDMRNRCVNYCKISTREQGIWLFILVI